MLDRRQFGVGCGAALPTVLLASPAKAQDTAPKPAPRTVKFPNGTVVPALGQGSWHLAQERHPLLVEEEALRTGIALGMTLIDTSGNYGDGSAERLIGHVIAGQRDRIFLVSKVEADTVFTDGGEGIARACDASLARLGTDRLDLYLLHSPVSDKLLPVTVAAFEKLRAAGKITAWGVSNFGVAQMETLFAVPDGNKCATNQVRYSLRYPYLEKDVLPWCFQHGMPVMADSPLGGDDNSLVSDRALAELGAKHGVTAAAMALAWAMRSGKVIAIPESGVSAHVRENAAALTLSV